MHEESPNWRGSYSLYFPIIQHQPHRSKHPTGFGDSFFRGIIERKHILIIPSTSRKFTSLIGCSLAPRPCNLHGLQIGRRVHFSTRVTSLWKRNRISNSSIPLQYQRQWFSGKIHRCHALQCSMGPAFDSRLTHQLPDQQARIFL